MRSAAHVRRGPLASTASLISSVERLRGILPHGTAISDSAWRARHHTVVALVLLHAIAIAVFATARGFGAGHGVMEASPIAALALLSASRRLGRNTRAIAATFGLILASAIVVHVSGGTIEAHFHFFVVIGVISLYQSWGPFLLAIGFVLVHHGVMGVIDPTAVYNHGAAISSPWRWAGIHAGFVLAASAAQLAAWRFAESARESKELMLESTGEAIIGVDSEARVTFVNRAAATMLVVNAKDAVGRSVFDVMPASHEDRTPVSVEQHPLSQTLHAGKKATARQIWVGHEPHRFPASATAAPILSRGRVIGAMIIVQDVTEQRRLDEMKDAFLTAVSHEMRTPLTSVIGYAETLQRHEGRLPQEQASEMLGRLGVNAHKLEQLLIDLLDLDKLKRGGYVPRRTESDVAQIALALVAESEVLRDRKVVISTVPTIAAVDPAKVERIIENLLNNAARHTAEDAHIWVDVHPCTHGAVIVVEDDGPGIPERLRESIFQPFSQGETILAHSPGVGIGLSLVSRFAEAHGGYARVTERVGGGASFRVHLPSAPTEPSTEISGAPACLTA